MAHYAFLDKNNVVTQVIVGRDEDDLVEGVTSWEVYYGNLHGQRCLRTSYNTKSGQHTGGGTPFRKNYAGIGYTYDDSRDAFIPPKLFPSWVLNEDTCNWDPPVPHPGNTANTLYSWDEESQNWIPTQITIEG